MKLPKKKCFGRYSPIYRICRETCADDGKCRVVSEGRKILHDIPCKWCGLYDLIKNGHNRHGKQMHRCRSCGQTSSNAFYYRLPGKFHYTRPLYNYAVSQLRKGISLRRTVLNIESRFKKSPSFRTLSAWAKREKITLSPRAEHELDGHERHMERAKQLLRENPGLDWNLAQALVSKEDEIRDHLNAERDRINIENMIDTFNKIYA